MGGSKNFKFIVPPSSTVGGRVVGQLLFSDTSSIFGYEAEMENCRKLWLLQQIAGLVS